MSSAPAWEGIFPSIPTAFAEDGALDLASQASVARFAVESGAQGLLCFGLAGEVFRLTPGERLDALEAIVEGVGGRIPVLAGVGAESLHTSVLLAREARAAGADGVVIPPPVTTRPSRRELAGRPSHPFGDALGTGFDLDAHDLGARTRQLDDELGTELDAEELGRVLHHGHGQLR